METLSLYEDEDTQAGPTATAKLAVDILGQQLKSSMSMSFRTIALRRENACAALKKAFIQDLSVDLCKLPFSDFKVFGSNAFSTLVKDLAGKERDRQSLELDLKPLSSRKKRGGSSGTGTARSNPNQASGSNRGSTRGRRIQ